MGRNIVPGGNGAIERAGFIFMGIMRWEIKGSSSGASGVAGWALSGVHITNIIGMMVK